MRCYRNTGGPLSCAIGAALVGQFTSIWIGADEIAEVGPERFYDYLHTTLLTKLTPGGEVVIAVSQSPPR